MAKINFRKQIRREMKKQTINVPQMAIRIKCSNQTLYDFFAGRKSLGADKLEAILKILGGRLTFGSVKSAPSIEEKR